ncbi:MAG: hypothetical protein GY719_18890 [bacterium]|nr:hypothetical protein [bacterium]
MTRRDLTRLLAGFLLLQLAAPVAGDTTPEAEKWLAKFVSVFERGPFKVDYNANLDLAAMGLTGTLTGNYAQADRTHSRMQVEIELKTPPEMAAEPVRMKVLSVVDGTTVWTEMDNPALGGRQVIKAALADADKVDESASVGIDPSSLDPVAQLENLSKTMDFEIVERAGGKVTLRGKATADTSSMLADLGGPGAAFIFVLDEKTGFPTELRADGENPFVTVTFDNLEFPKKESLPAGLFEYTPPEGLPVLDRSAQKD